MLKRAKDKANNSDSDPTSPHWLVQRLQLVHTTTSFTFSPPLYMSPIMYGPSFRPLHVLWRLINRARQCRVLSSCSRAEAAQGSLSMQDAIVLQSSERTKKSDGLGTHISTHEITNQLFPRQNKSKALAIDATPQGRAECRESREYTIPHEPATCQPQLESCQQQT